MAEIIGAARRILEAGGPETLTMRRVADELGIQAPSLYKHFASKAELELALVTDAMAEIGEASHDCGPPRRGAAGPGRAARDLPPLQPRSPPFVPPRYGRPLGP